MDLLLIQAYRKAEILMQRTTYPTDRHHIVERTDFDRQLQPQRHRIYNLANRILRNRDDAEDIVQETFVRAISNYGRFESGSSLAAWVTRIAKNLCLDTIRRRRRHRTFSLDTPSARPEVSELKAYEVADSTLNPSTQVLAAQVDELLLRSLHNLPAHYRRAVLLREQEYSYEEISELMGCPLGTIRSRLHRARALIRKQLETIRNS
jgi:RNA polymerase sigma-70 factor (ECF subfamily)